MIIYSKFSGAANGAVGKLETPIKMVIEHESDMQTKKGGICDWLFNIEKSGKFRKYRIKVYSPGTGRRSDFPSLPRQCGKFADDPMETGDVCFQWIRILCL